MKNQKYKDYNIKNYKKIVIVLFVVVFILFFVLNWLENLEKKLEENEVGYKKLSSIQDVVEYYESKYISEQYSRTEGFYLDVYVNFKYPLYENDVSKEEYYTNLLTDAAKIIYYNSYNMIDEERGITINVICSDNKIDKIIINGKEDFFIYMDSQISMKKFVEIENTELYASSEVLQNCINNDWNGNIYFGEKESIFDEYYIYFDEGLKVRIIDGKIYNIIFTEKYSSNVIGNLFPGIDLQTVAVTLGKPTFEDDEINIIGYKGNDFYVFFTEDEISVYRNSNIDSDEFFKLADKYIAETIDFREFMNELTYLWPDYSEYEYNSTSVFISYPLKGVEIAINRDDINGILVYNNNKSTLSKINRYLEDTKFVGRLQLDLVYETEKRRVKNENELIKKCDEYLETIDDENKEIIGESLNYKFFANKDENGFIYEMKFISKDGERPNRQLLDGISNYLWLTSDYFLYSKEGKGIFFYNLNTGRVQRIIVGDERYILKSYENGILKYDDIAIEIQF